MVGRKTKVKMKIQNYKISGRKADHPARLCNL